MDAKEIFTAYYQNNAWRSTETRSGFGSEIKSTQHIIREIPILLKDFNIKSMLDAPCGDFNWMKYIDLSDINYVGIDIVEELIYKNNKQFSSAGIQFHAMDILSDALPCVDLILCRDCLFHLPNKLVLQALSNFIKSGSCYMLTTQHIWRGETNNADIPIGGWRRLNLEMPPFDFPPPLRTIIEGKINRVEEDRTLCLWKIADIQAIIGGFAFTGLEERVEQKPG